MQFSVMYMKMMGVNNDSGVVHSAITRCQVQRYCPKENVWCGVTILFCGGECSCRQLSSHDRAVCDPSIVARWDTGHHFLSTG